MATYRIRIEGHDYDETRLLRDAYARWRAQQERDEGEASPRPSGGGPSRGRVANSADMVDDDASEDAGTRTGWRAIQRVGGLDEFLAQAEDREYLRAFLRLLFVHSPAQWEAVEMCILDGMSERAVGAHLGITGPGVHQRLVLAGRHLRRAMDGLRLVRRVLWRRVPRLVEEWAMLRFDADESPEVSDLHE